MKYLPIILSLLLIACGETPSDPQPTPTKDSVIICDFNLDTTQMGIVTRDPIPDDEIRAARPGRGKKPTQPSGTGLPTILLDFDGHTAQNTSWQNGSLVLENSGMTASEMQAVWENFYRLYNPFGIHITTSETEYNAAPSNKRVRVVFTVSSSWYGSAGGVAYIGSFTWGDNTPAFVFTQLLNFNTKYIKDAGVHEAGHTLGLPHAAQVSLENNVCAVQSEYLRGTNVMGVTYYDPTSLFGNAVYSPYCTVVNQLTTIQNTLR